MARLNQSQSLSIIIPSFNEASNLPLLLADLNLWPSHLEICVCDACSSDLTHLITVLFGARFVKVDKPNRGVQLHHGACNTNGEWLLFLHADSRMSMDWPETVKDIITKQSSKNIAWFFDFKVQGGPIEFYAISLKRARMREKVDPGNWELWLDGGANLVKLIDDSKATANPTSGIGGRVFNVVSGSIQTGTAVTKTAAASQAGGGIGLFYPDTGLIVLNGNQVDSLVADITSDSGSNTLGGNVPRFFDSIVQGAKFQARREERLSSTHYFCRAGNKEFNFSNNPTFFTASDGTFTQATFFKDPKTYITTVGLFNGSNELLAVAKLSQPVLKSYSREALIKVKLDF